MKNNSTVENYLQITAQKLRHVLESDVVSDAKKEIVGDIIISLANEAGLGVDDPKIIEYSFPLMIDAVGNDYARAIIHSLEAIFDYSMPVINVPEKLGELEKLAAQISEVLRNPLLPKQLYNVWSDELTENPHDTDSKEWILGNLKRQNEVQK